MLLKAHEIRYILKQASGVGDLGEYPKLTTDNEVYLFKTHGGYIEVLISGRFFTEIRAKEIKDSYEGIPPSTLSSEVVSDWKTVLWHCELPVNT